MSQKILNYRYKITREIGRGGFGITYLAEDQTNANSLCVVKQLNPYNAEISTAKRLFQREAKTLKELKEAEQIPDFVEYFEEDSNYYIVQEYIQGKTLDTLIHENWDSESLSRFLWDVLSVLEKLHKNNIIHRDIKPANLIKSDFNCKIVVIDFGAVKQLNISQNNANSSQENQVLNQPTATRIATAEYAPREQKQGKPLLNSDIYALGMTALQLVTKISPIAIKRNNQDNIVLDRPFNNIDPPLLAILNKMVKNDHKKRYQSASEVLKAIDSRAKEPPTHINLTEPLLSNLNNKTLQPTEPLLSNLNNKTLQPTEPLLSTLNNKTLQPTEPLPSNAHHLNNGKNSSFSSTKLVFNIVEKNTEEKIIYDQDNSNNLSNYHGREDNTLNLLSANLKNKPFLISLSIIGLIILISEFIAPWIRPIYFTHQGNRLLEQKQAEESLKQFYTVTSLQENSFVGWKGQGDALLTLGRVSGALGAYKKANSLKPNNVEILNDLGKVYYEQDNHQAALDALDRATKFNPKFASAWLNKGLNLIALERYEDALKSLDRARDLEPQNPYVWRNRGLVLQNLGRPSESGESYQKALELGFSATAP
jgi:serine/threonine protein kinase